MEAVTIKILSQNGKEAGSAALNSAVFGAVIKADQVHQTVRWQRNKIRAGTHSTLTRGNMKGGKKKPWKQKHTGRARCGSGVSPLWVGGAVVFGPQPRKYDFRLTKRAKKEALLSALSAKVSAGELIVLDSLELKEGKTKEMIQVLQQIGAGSASALIIAASGDVKTDRAARNIPGVKVLGVSGLNVYDILNHKFLVGTKDTLGTLEKRLLE